jgi:hypothetical protein
MTFHFIIKLITRVVFVIRPIISLLVAVIVVVIVVL